MRAAQTNGYAYQGNLPVGDFDAWTFTANTGDAIKAEGWTNSTPTALIPVRLYGPDGVLLGSSRMRRRLRWQPGRRTAVFLVVIGNNPYYSDAGSGTYSLTLAKTGSQIMVHPEVLAEALWSWQLQREFVAWRDRCLDVYPLCWRVCGHPG